jgi:GNAT superfamily N-acetyltransferase
MGGSSSRAATAVPLTPDDVGEIVTVFSDAFRDYPVMRFVLGSSGLYDQRLRRLVELFVSGRTSRNEPMFGVRDAAGALVAAVTTTLPVSPPAPSTFLTMREAIWTELGADARARYDAFTGATQGSAIVAPHFHLNMIGVRRAQQGTGLARVLLEAVHDLSASEPRSTGVSLTTELPANVTLYERFGYRVRGHARVSDALETWTLFRAAS